jgi:NAD(P)-dependent dehydrogenase (short-subunit alcohol dehydrogenase family)
MADDKKVALVTGAANGIGRAIARKLSTDGFAIAIADLEDASAVVDEIKSAGGQASSGICDCGDPAQVTSFCQAVEQTHGSIDVLVHSAGIYPRQPFAEITHDDWHRVIGINLNSLFYLTKACVPSMQSKGWGRVIALASNTFYLGIPELSHYQASKGGVVGFIRGLSAEVGGDGITCNSVAPTLTRTKGSTETSPHAPEFFDFIAQMQSIKRTGEPEDVVGTVAFLASDDSAFMTGQTLMVDGGFAKL